MDQIKVPVSTAAYRRQKQIEECLYENLLLRPYPSVSICDLCHQLGISRKSFYNYFPDKDSCFRAIINRKLRACILRLTKDLPEDVSLEDAIAYYLSLWKNEKNLLDIVVRNNLVFLLSDQCFHFLKEEDNTILPFLDTLRLKADAFVLAGFVNVQVTMMLQWYLQNFATPVEQMVQIYLRLFYQPLLTRETGSLREKAMENGV